MILKTHIDFKTGIQMDKSFHGLSKSLGLDATVTVVKSLFLGAKFVSSVQAADNWGVFFRCPQIMNDLNDQCRNKPVAGQADIVTSTSLCVSVPCKLGFQRSLQPIETWAAHQGVEPDQALHLSQRFAFSLCSIPPLLCAP